MLMLTAPEIVSFCRPLAGRRSGRALHSLEALGRSRVAHRSRYSREFRGHDRPDVQRDGLAEVHRTGGRHSNGRAGIGNRSHLLLNLFLIMALEEARKRGLLTVALLGYDGGEILRRGLADWPLVVHCDYIPRIQEVQASIYHIVRETLEVLHRGEA